MNSCLPSVKMEEKRAFSMMPCSASLVDLFLFKPPKCKSYEFPAKTIRLRTARGNWIAASFLKRKTAKVTILYSHGNAEDLNICYWFLKKLSRNLNANLIAYDYSGYGESSGEPSEVNCYADIDAVYDYLINVQHLSPDQIVLYGRSLGSGPSCYLASKSADQGRSVAGLILHAPFTSVYRVVLDVGFTLSGDRFPNIDRMASIRCKVFIVHGELDGIVPFQHSLALLDALPTRYRAKPFWVKGMKHNNESVHSEDMLIRHVNSYLNAHVTSRQLHKKRARLL